MTLFSLPEDEVGPGMVNIPQELSFMEATIRFLIRHIFNNEKYPHCKQEKTNDSQDQV